VPVEVYHLLARVTWLRVGILVVNLAVVAYMAWLLTESRRLARKTAATPPA
jgi:uncharacterized membrane protein (DUF2068 family)